MASANPEKEERLLMQRKRGEHKNTHTHTQKKKKRKKKHCSRNGRAKPPDVPVLHFIDGEGVSHYFPNKIQTK